MAFEKDLLLNEEEDKTPSPQDINDSKCAIADLDKEVKLHFIRTYLHFLNHFFNLTILAPEAVPTDFSAFIAKCHESLNTIQINTILNCSKNNFEWNNLNNSTLSTEQMKIVRTYYSVLRVMLNLPMSIDDTNYLKTIEPHYSKHEINGDNLKKRIMTLTAPLLNIIIADLVDKSLIAKELIKRAQEAANSEVELLTPRKKHRMDASGTSVPTAQPAPISQQTAVKLTACSHFFANYSNSHLTDIQKTQTRLLNRIIVTGYCPDSIAPWMFRSRRYLPQIPTQPPQQATTAEAPMPQL